MPDNIFQNPGEETPNVNFPNDWLQDPGVNMVRRPAHPYFFDGVDCIRYEYVMHIRVEHNPIPHNSRVIVYMPTATLEIKGGVAVAKFIEEYRAYLYG